MTHEKDTEQKIELMIRMQVFKSWPRNDLTRLAHVMMLKRFTPNKVIIKQGESPQGVFFIKTGRCKLVKEMVIRETKGIEKEPNKRFLQIGVLGTGDYFGELAVLENLKEELISVISEGNVEVYILPKFDFHHRIFVCSQ
jgi:CRP-like cAMP-binding protein